MFILGIETSCDETSGAVVEEVADPARPWLVRSNVVASQVAIHREWGGVVPELASRQHVRDICGVVEQALGDASVAQSQIDAIAVTQGPGLVGSLLVGLSFAKSLAAAWRVPLVPVHHLAGHIESLFLQHGPLPLPAIVLVVSGGHTSLYEVRQPGRYTALGRTRDDAAGEAYDKVAKLIGLGYPGGPVIDRLAKTGNDQALSFPVARMTHPDRSAPLQKGQWDFSFSGLKTSVLRYVKSRGDGWTPDASETADLCASFQRAVVGALIDKTLAAARWYGARSIGIAGGVSANSRLRADAAAAGERFGIPVFVPPISLSTDNAAMIAAAGLRRFHEGVRAGADLNADPALKLEARG
jgi:N6-L-threonylcarbamoyladenine synthase